MPRAGWRTAASGWPVGNHVTRTALDSVSHVRAALDTRMLPVSVEVSERGSETTRRGDARVCFATLSPRRTTTTRTGVSKRTCTGFPVRVWIQWVFTCALGVTTVSSLCSSDPTMCAAQPGRFATSEMWSVSPGCSVPRGQTQPFAVRRIGTGLPCESVAVTETSFVPQPATVKRARAWRALTTRDDGYAVLT